MILEVLGMAPDRFFFFFFCGGGGGLGGFRGLGSRV